MQNLKRELDQIIGTLIYCGVVGVFFSIAIPLVIGEYAKRLFIENPRRLNDLEG